MAQQIINNGETGLVVRTKLNDNFTELYDKTSFYLVGHALNYTELNSTYPPSEHSNEWWGVIEAQGSILLLNRKPAGLYKSDGSTWKYQGISLNYLLDDSNFVINDGTDITKKLKFELNQISTGNSRILTMSDYDQNLAYPLFENIKLSTSYTNTDSEPIGTIYWDSDASTFTGVLTGGVKGQFFEESFITVKNQTGSTLLNGRAIMYEGSVGASGNLKAQYAIADGSLPARYTVGIVTEDIANGEDGKVTWFGKVRGVDTSGISYGETWEDGDEVYISTTNPGYLTNVRPEAPELAISMAIVIKAHSNGTLMVRPSWLGRVQDMDDVDGTPLTTTGQLLVWDNDNGYFDPNFNINDYVTIDSFDAEVSNNTDVTANTANRHVAVTVTDSSEISFTLTNQDITADLIDNSINSTKLSTAIQNSLCLADSSLQEDDKVTTLEAITGEIDTSFITPQKLLEVLELSYIPYYGAVDDLYMPEYTITSGRLKAGNMLSGNYTEIETGGTIKFHGDATVFDDVVRDVTNIKVQGTGVSINVAENTLDFTDTAQLNDYAYTNYQIPHGWKVGSTIFPHIHWQQNKDATPNWLLQYRWQINGENKVTAWTNYSIVTDVYTYVSGTINQITHNNGIVPPIGADISDIIQVRVVRDTDNSSTEFAAVDAYTGDAEVTDVDIHFEKDTLGSREEYIK